MTNFAVPIMVAPSGARLTQADHPGVPVTIEQTVQCALECQQAGAHALHAHVRDRHQKHLLDAEAYRSLLTLAEQSLGKDFPVQITTEAFGIYSAEEQIALVKAIKPQFASMAMREIIRTPDVTQARGFYRWCLDENVGVQHILYGADDLKQFSAHQENDVIPAEQNAILMVIGRYTDNMVADTNECARLVETLQTKTPSWMLCAFGQTETACLTQTANAGGGVRVGFENNTQHNDGSVAVNNAERVEAVAKAIGNTADSKLDADWLYRILGGL